ncbi:uncharacterized protein [Rutidosis leptorrhynchoides]|uniref:uncharacterized protein n=1 Tax=Rutidosis leptorrhynchoides TaxID=125765 RepID=UPI003A9A12DB
MEAIGPTIFSDVNDYWQCRLLLNGVFSVSSLRKLIDASPMGSWPTHWCKVVPSNINFFIWRARLNRLPDKCNLIDKGVSMQDVLCSACNAHGEDLPHIFFNCDTASQVWNNIAAWIDLTIPVWNSVNDIWQWIMTSSMPPTKMIVLEVICYSTLWPLWCFRNACIFDLSSFKKCHILDFIVSSSFDWLSSRYKKANLNWNI